MTFNYRIDVTMERKLLPSTSSKHAYIKRIKLNNCYLVILVLYCTTFIAYNICYIMLALFPLIIFLNKHIYQNVCRLSTILLI